MKLPKTA